MRILSTQMSLMKELFYYRSLLYYALIVLLVPLDLLFYTITIILSILLPLLLYDSIYKQSM